MKTKEFIKRVEELGYLVNKVCYQIEIVGDNFTVAIISTKRMYVIKSFCFVDVEWKNQDKLFDLIIEYAKTPIDERKEDKKFYLKHRYFEIAGGGRGFFTTDNDSVLPSLSYKRISDRYIQIFTLKEIEAIKEKYNTNLSDFEMIEVEDD